MIKGITQTRKSVLLRAGNGDADEFARLYGPLAYAAARRCGLGEEDAEDVRQQSLMELLSVLRRFQYDRDRGSFKGLVKKVVRARAIDVIRRRRGSKNIGSLSLLREPRAGAPGKQEHNKANCQGDDPFEQLFEEEWRKVRFAAALEDVRSEVQEATLQAFTLTAVEGWSLRDAARWLGLSVNQVSQYRARIAERLRKSIRGFEDR